eukprot:UN19279
MTSYGGDWGSKLRAALEPKGNVKVTEITACNDGFAALKSDGSVVIWGGSQVKTVGQQYDVEPVIINKNPENEKKIEIAYVAGMDKGFIAVTKTK